MTTCHGCLHLGFAGQDVRSGRYVCLRRLPYQTVGRWYPGGEDEPQRLTDDCYVSGYRSFEHRPDSDASQERHQTRQNGPNSTEGSGGVKFYISLVKFPDEAGGEIRLYDLARSMDAAREVIQRTFGDPGKWILSKDGKQAWANSDTGFEHYIIERDVNAGDISTRDTTPGEE